MFLTPKSLKTSDSLQAVSKCSLCPFLISYYSSKQVNAQVHEKEQNPRLPGPTCVWGATPNPRTAHRPAAATEHSASHALPAQPVPGPGETHWGACGEVALRGKSEAKKLGREATLLCSFTLAWPTRDLS